MAKHGQNPRRIRQKKTVLSHTYSDRSDHGDATVTMRRSSGHAVCGYWSSYIRTPTNRQSTKFNGRLYPFPITSLMQFIDLKAQFHILESNIRTRMDAVLEHGQFIMGPEIRELEAQLAAYVGVKHAITAASGTDSLEIALRALDIGPGHEVITVPFTWISSAEVIAQVGARPVFVDIDPATFNMDPDRLEATITPNTKAIMPVCLFGLMADCERINAIAGRFGLPVIEDAAQSFGATQSGRRSGGVTTIGSTSFFPAKPLGCYGDGGALFTDDDQLADKIRAIRTHGGLQRHHHPYIGMNGRLDTLQAAVLLAKLERFDWEVQRRFEIGERYTQRLTAECPDIVPPLVAKGYTSVYAQYTIRHPNRDELAAKLKEQGIPTAVYYPKCLHEQPAFTFCGYHWGDFPESEKASREVLSLPMHPYLSTEDQDRIISALR
jgi:UDP-2-acetamido-2-deoxy-ribo-hexuluronate aminotransferase